jgi:membrane protein DedA with SNARE-associated domain
MNFFQVFLAALLALLVSYWAGYCMGRRRRRSGRRHAQDWSRQ